MRGNHTIVHVVRLHLSREDASASALFVSPEREDFADLIEHAAKMGITAEVDIDSAPYCDKSSIAEWMKQFDREATPPAAIERPEYEQRLDELTRAQRNTQRQLATIAGMLAELLPAAKANAMQDQIVAQEPKWAEHAKEGARKFGIPDDAVPPADIDRVAESAPRHIDRLGRGYSTERGETSQNEAQRSMASQVTGAGGVLPGNMALQGGSASSEVWGVDGNGEAKQSSLPKVGDSLKPPHLRRS